MPRAARIKHVTVSLGMAMFQASDESTELFTRADQAMYRVKDVGGNRVCLHDGENFTFLN
jgi:GGDEF domain-containing protein